MLIEKKNVAELLPADYNPRKDLKPGDKEYEKLKRSIEQFGYVEPVIWNATTSRVVGGHQRLKVLIDMGITEVECVIVEMDEDKEKALNVALNKISGEWDNDKLALLIADLQGADFDVSLTGFEPEELEDLFREDTKKGVQDDNFDVDAELVKPTFSKTGDLWLLGDHRLVCGDSTKPETYELLMNSGDVGICVSLDDGASYSNEVPLDDWLNTDVEDLWNSLPESRRVYFHFILHDNAALSRFKITYIN